MEVQDFKFMYYTQLSDQTYVESIKFYFSYHKDAVSDDDFPDITLDYGKDLINIPMGVHVSYTKNLPKLNCLNLSTEETI